MESSLEEIEGVKFLFLREADPYKRGLAHGSLLKEEIRGQAGDVSSYIYDKLGRAQGKIFTEIAFRKALRLKNNFSPQEIREMEGISEGSGLSLRWILLFNSVYEIAISFRSTFVGCSFFAVPFRGGEEVVIGKTIDLYFEKKVTEFMTKRRVIFVYGDNGSASSYIAPSLPGLLATDSIVTEEGTLFAVNDGGGAHKGVDFSNTPIVSIVRDLAKIESKARIWLSALKRMKSIRPFACLLSDGRAQNTFLVEMCQGDYFVKRMEEVVINTNHFTSEEMKEKWYLKNYEAHKEYKVTLKRMDNIKKMVETGISSFDEAIEVLKIHENTFSPEKGSVSNKGTVQGFVTHLGRRKIFFPAGEVVPVTFYGSWKEFSLDEIFEKV